MLGGPELPEKNLSCITDQLPLLLERKAGDFRGSDPMERWLLIAAAFVSSELFHPLSGCLVLLGGPQDPPEPLAHTKGEQPLC